jgi:glycosyltransferase involved in cell wall biosynthesis
MLQRVKLSIVLPTNKIDDFFSRALYSIEADLPDDAEILVVLNGPAIGQHHHSPFNSKFGRKIRFLNSYADGLVPALNLGLAQAFGEFIARMDGDDVSIAGRLGSQLEFLQENPEYSVVGSQFIEICIHGVMGAKSVLPKKIRAFPMPPLHTKIAHPTAMYRKSRVLSLGGYRAEFAHAEDQDLWLRLLKESKLGNLREVYLQYRRHPNQVSVENYLDQQLGLIQTYLVNYGLEGELNEILKANTATQFKSVIMKSALVSQAKKLKLRMAVDYWRFSVSTKRNPGKFVREAFTHPIIASIFLWANRQAVLRILARKAIYCELCNYGD